MADQTLYEKEHGPDKIRVYVKEINGGSDVWVDFSSPGVCDCVRSRSLSTCIELMLKITDKELWSIAPRDYDIAGHRQNCPPPTVYPLDDEGCARVRLPPVRPSMQS